MSYSKSVEEICNRFFGIKEKEVNKEEREAIEILNNFKNNNFEKDKLEIEFHGGLKIGELYKTLELDPAIEIILNLNEKYKKEIKELENQYDTMQEMYRRRIKELKGME